ncbi:hypothetical protein ACOAKC_11555 [Hathewaya histolytica]|uniref:hypothetical protein n=1 Tax=Hathewaya histolytica TaxID=1498 RepID=UPI003B6849C0
MAKNNKKFSYGPHKREYMEAPRKVIKAYSEKGDFTLLPDNVQDDIVVNNISNQEFDYTYGDIENDNLNDLTDV